MANIALILAGGTGSRMGGEIPKQFLTLSNNKEIIIMSIDAFANTKAINNIVVVCHKDYVAKLEMLIKSQHYKTPVSVISGGDTRQQSSYIGLCSLQNEFSGEDIVLIHDAARPFVTEKIILENIATVKVDSACTTAIPAQNTILISNGQNFVSSIPDRSKMYAVQTPQSFRLSLILNAHEAVDNSHPFTDDAGIVLSYGAPVSIVYGSKKNIKITSLEDLKIAESFLY